MNTLTLTAMCLITAAEPNAPKQSTYSTSDIRRLASDDDHYSDILLLVLNEKAYPAYREILSDPKSTANELVGVLRALHGFSSAPKQPFRPLVLQCTLHKEARVRAAAAGFLEVIGTSSDMPLLATMLSDDTDAVAISAANTLTAIGGAGELMAFDSWLTQMKDKDTKRVRYIRQYRAKLAERLKSAGK